MAIPFASLYPPTFPNPGLEPKTQLGAGGGMGFLHFQNLRLVFLGAIYSFYLSPMFFPDSGMERSRRVSMTAWMFSPNVNNFCQFMTPNLPKTRFLTQIHPGLVVALAFYVSKN